MDWMREEEKRPDAKLYQILAGVALGLQAAAVALSVYIWADQRKVKELFSGAPEILEASSLPWDYIVINVVPALLYLLFFVFLLAAANKRAGCRIGAGIFFGIGCLLKIVLEYLPQFTSVFWHSLYRAPMDSVQLASHMALGSAINMASRPLSVTAFGLFCLAAGTSLGSGRPERV